MSEFPHAVIEASGVRPRTASTALARDGTFGIIRPINAARAHTSA
jgi:hypothetical protein